MKSWIKFYTEALHDRKMRRLDRFDKSVYYDLLLLAGYDDKGGYLPSLEDIALELNLKKSVAKKSIDKLLKVGLLIENKNSLFVISVCESDPQNLRNSKEYSDWRNAVFNRDDYTCQLCGQHGGKLNAHHIKQFKKFPELRLDLDNGITLCERCHKKVHHDDMKDREFVALYFKHEIEIKRN